VTTTADLIEEARTQLHSGQEERRNRLDGPITSTATTVPFKYPIEGLDRGAIIGVDLEEIRVWETSGQSATVVERGVNGSAKASHLDLANVTVASKFSRARILRAMNRELQALSSPANGLFQMKPVELTYQPSTAGYDLAGVSSIDDIWQIEARTSMATKDWVPLESHRYRLDRAANTSDFPSGFALFLPGGGGQAGQPIRIWYRAPFTLLSTTDVTYDVAQTGLPATAEDLLPLGALLRLVPPRDIKRAFTEGQGSPRRAEEVPPNAASQSVSSLRKFRADRVAEEAARLSRLYPHRHRRTA
jgi:hypothetical protein